ncbi:MAG: hypothetical protein RJA61_449 [Candidatus Parcubacteria bacterium]
MSIKESFNKIKGSIQAIPQDIKYNFFITFLIILVGTASFGLGRLSVSDIQKNTDIKVFLPEGLEANVLQGFEQKDIQNSSEKQGIPENVYVPDQGGEVVASKSGSKYHFPWCTGAKQISEKNLISFPSVEEARSAGYTPAANCKGLK